MTTSGNYPVSAVIRDDYLWVTVDDNRILAAPLDWFPWLAAATPEQQACVELTPQALQWPDLGKQIDLETFLSWRTTPGQKANDEDYITVKEMADMVGVAPNTLHVILREDQAKPSGERRIPGAYKMGGERRGIWRIPRHTAATWERDTRGRKSPLEKS